MQLKMIKLFLVYNTKSSMGMDDKLAEIKSFYHKTKKILSNQRLHGFFGSPKGLSMHFCSLRTAHVLINYDINTDNISVLPVMLSILMRGRNIIYKV